MPIPIDQSVRVLARVTVVEAEACHFCEDASNALQELKALYPLELRIINARDAIGAGLMQEHRAAMSPLILVDDEFFSQGRLPRAKLQKLLEGRAQVVSQ